MVRHFGSVSCVLIERGEEEMAEDFLDLKVIRIHRLQKGGKVVAFADLSVNDALVIKGLRIVKGSRGVFVTMPQEKGKNNRWYDTVHCLSKDVSSAVAQCVLSAYESEDKVENDQSSKWD